MSTKPRGGYAAEGPFMSLKQMSTQILSVEIDEQPKYIDLQRMRARQIWDEVKHGQLHADVLLRGGFIKREEELMDDPRANIQPRLSYFGLTAMFPHIHPSLAPPSITTPNRWHAWALPRHSASSTTTSCATSCTANRPKK
jgi:hypothetical protein